MLRSSRRMRREGTRLIWLWHELLLLRRHQPRDGSRAEWDMSHQWEGPRGWGFFSQPGGRTPLVISDCYLLFPLMEAAAAVPELGSDTKTVSNGTMAHQ